MGYDERLDEEQMREARLRPRRRASVILSLVRPIRDDDIVWLLRQSPFFATDLAHRLRVVPGRLYPVLARLEKQGRVTSWWTYGPNNTRRRLYGVKSRSNHEPSVH